jgi:putative membrane protein insertion efficiency factor
MDADKSVRATGLGAAILIAMINFYRHQISPYTMPSCKFTPTCSRYALDAVRRYGVFKGAWLATWRVLRCNPFTRGGYDPLV